MIKLRAPLKIETDPQGAWQLVFWVGEAFDYTIPFRTMLSDIADTLGEDGGYDLQLPAHEQGEDFIEGSLRFGSTRLGIYFEYSLGYFALMGDSENILRDVVERLRSGSVVT